MDPTRHVGKGIPYRRFPAVRLGGAFDLERGGRHAKDEIAGKAVGKNLGIGHGGPFSMMKPLQRCRKSGSVKNQTVSESYGAR
jgi:hypothetical protein